MSPSLNVGCEKTMARLRKEVNIGRGTGVFQHNVAEVVGIAAYPMGQMLQVVSTKLFKIKLQQ